MPRAPSPGRDSILRNLGLPTSTEGNPKIPEIPKGSGLSLLLSIQFLIYIGWSVVGCGPQLLGHWLTMSLFLFVLHGIEWCPSEDSLGLVKSCKLVAIVVLQKSDKWARVYPSHWPTTTTATSANFANETAHNQGLVGIWQIILCQRSRCYATTLYYKKVSSLVLSCCHICSFWLLTILKTSSMLICCCSSTCTFPTCFPSLFTSVTIIQCLAASIAMSAWNRSSWKSQNIFLPQFEILQFVVQIKSLWKVQTDSQ